MRENRSHSQTDGQTIPGGDEEGKRIRGRIDPEPILLSIADDWRVLPSEILGRTRSREVSEARKEFATELREAGWTLSAIGRLLKRDHSTILYLIRSAEAVR